MNLIASALEPSKELRVYVLNGGHLAFKDMAMFSDTADYDGKAGDLAAPCFLIQHPKGILLWDTGLGDALVGHPVDFLGFVHESVEVPLAKQLKDLGLEPKDITYVGFSHLHADHSGNANLFASSTWLLQESELNFALSTPTPMGVVPSTFSDYGKAATNLLHGDYDVFGDGKVKILHTPGHTPGHQCLLVKLAGGSIILSGDLYHLNESRRRELVPPFNFSRADTLASINRIEKLAKKLHARVIVQHDSSEFSLLPKPPQYLK